MMRGVRDMDPEEVGPNGLDSMVLSICTIKLFGLEEDAGAGIRDLKKIQNVFVKKFNTQQERLHDRGQVVRIEAFDAEILKQKFTRENVFRRRVLQDDGTYRDLQLTAHINTLRTRTFYWCGTFCNPDNTDQRRRLRLRQRRRLPQQQQQQQQLQLPEESQSNHHQIQQKQMLKEEEEEDDDELLGMQDLTEAIGAQNHRRLLRSMSQRIKDSLIDSGRDYFCSLTCVEINCGGEIDRSDGC
uniref:Uncharacterized protein n=1 Tax=Cyclophora tenuis TaxID=216820 RepID=A0A7S1D8U5_CYCTE|mmetsp:Transcript_279/g.451  ORF Transcript_279/g.451 Transcript_279/m.451 type:complete len:242 (+) Transcript_279:230-955(+)